MNEIVLINTELGKVPVVICNKTNKFHGYILWNKKIKVDSPTKKSCLYGLQKAFEFHIYTWLKLELSDLNLINGNDLNF